MTLGRSHFRTIDAHQTGTDQNQHDARHQSDQQSPDGTVGVDPGVRPQVDFNEAIAAATANKLELTGPEGLVPAAISLVNGGTSMLLIPDASLTLGATYTLTATTGITDTRGNTLASEISASFTIKQPDATVPTVTAVAPNDGAIGVPVTTQVVASFSEAIAPATIDTTSVTLTPDGGSPVAAQVVLSANGLSVTLIPSAELALNTLHHVTITTDVTDLVGNPLAAVFTSSFTTESGDITGPALLDLTPANGATDVTIRPVIRAVFDEVLDPATVDPADLVLRDATSAVVASTLTHAAGDTTLELRPDNVLAFGASYTFELSGDMTDLTGNAVTASGATFTAISSTFTTGSFAITSPVDGTDVMEGSDITLAASTGIALADVVFEINGQPLAPVGAPFSTSFTVPPIAQAPVLTIIASGRDAGGVVVAEDTVTVNVVPGLTVEPRILGVPLGGSANMMLKLSGPLSTNLPVVVSIIQTEVASVPDNIIIPAGQTELLLPVSGLEQGNTVVTVSSAQGGGTTIVSVSPVISGEDIPVATRSLGVSIFPSPVIGKIILPVGATRSIGVTLFNTPVAEETTVVTTNSDVSIVGLAAPVVIPAGSTVANVSLSGLAAGQATIQFHLGNGLIDMPVIVGGSSATTPSGVSSQPLGISIQPPVFVGGVVVPESSSRTVSLSIIGEPAVTPLPVTLVSSDPAIVSVPADATIPAGSQSITLDITSGNAGVAELTITIDGQTYIVQIIVGSPPAGFASGVASQSVGISIQPPVFIGGVVVPEFSGRTVSLVILGESAVTSLPVTLISSDPAIVSVPADGTILAGSQALTLDITTGNAGVAELTITIEGETYIVQIIVGPPPAGFASGVASQPVGISIQPPLFIGGVVLPESSSHSVSLGILGEPAFTALPATLVSSDPAIVSVPTDATIPAGSQSITLDITSGIAGVAELTIVVDGQTYVVQIIVGPPPAGFASGVVSQPVGISIRPIGTAGTLIMEPLGLVTVQLPLLSAPATTNVSVNAVSRDSAVADVNVSPLTIGIGETSAVLTVIATTDTAGQTLIDLTFNEEHRTLQVIVGLPATGEEPVTISPTMGVEVQ